MLKIISGGQTGVDRGALDAAIAAGFPCGGWCPKGRKAEDGIISAKYPLQELQASGYSQRTHKNVIASNASVIIYFTVLMGGTEETLYHCIEYQKPYLLVDADDLLINKASQRILQFMQQIKMDVLNIAGPRASENPGAYVYAKQCLLGCLLDYQQAYQGNIGL